MRWPWQKRQVMTVPLREKRANIAAETGGAFRRGMWVQLGSQIGLLVDLVPTTGDAIVMITDHETGLNVVQIGCKLGELQRAKRSQIPPVRRAHLTEGDLERFGYPG